MSAPSSSVSPAKRVLNRSKCLLDARAFFSICTQDDAETLAKKHNMLMGKFNYFCKDFLDTANASDVILPLDIVFHTERDPFYDFIKQGAPRVIFHLLSSQAGNLRFIRCALSLLLITLQILRGNLIKAPSVPHLYTSRTRLKHNSETAIDESNISEALVAATKAVPNANAGLAGWTAEVLDKLGDSVGVLACTKLLTQVHVPAIQELALRAISELVSVSHEATECLLSSPVSSPTKSSKRPATQLTNMSDLFSLLMAHKNNFKFVEICADIVMIMSSIGEPDMCEKVACTVALFPPASLDVAVAASTTAAKLNHGPKGSKTEMSSPNNNLKKNPKEFQAASMLLPATGVPATGRLRSSSGGGECTPTLPALSSQGTLSWAGVKIFLSFLSRYGTSEGDIVSSVGGSAKPDMSASSSSSVFASERERGDSFEEDEEIIPAELTRFGVTSEESTRLMNTIQKVLVSLSFMIVHSSVVAQYVVRLPGAVDVLVKAGNARLRRNTLDGNVNVSDKGAAEDIVVTCIRLILFEQRYGSTPNSCSNSVANSVSNSLGSSRPIRPTTTDANGSSPLFPSDNLPSVSTLRPNTATDDTSRVYQEMCVALPSVPPLPDIITDDEIQRRWRKNSSSPKKQEALKLSYTLQSNILQEISNTGYMRNAHMNRSILDRAKAKYNMKIVSCAPATMKKKGSRTGSKRASRPQSVSKAIPSPQPLDGIESPSIKGLSVGASSLESDVTRPNIQWRSGPSYANM